MALARRTQRAAADAPWALPPPRTPTRTLRAAADAPWALPPPRTPTRTPTRTLRAARGRALGLAAAAVGVAARGRAPVAAAFFPACALALPPPRPPAPPAPPAVRGLAPPRPPALDLIRPLCALAPPPPAVSLDARTGLPAERFVKTIF